MAKQVTNEDFVHKLHEVNPYIVPLDEYKKAIEKYDLNA